MVHFGTLRVEEMYNSSLVGHYGSMKKQVPLDKINLVGGSPT